MVAIGRLLGRVRAAVATWWAQGDTGPVIGGNRWSSTELPECPCERCWLRGIR